MIDKPEPTVEQIEALADKIVEDMDTKSLAVYVYEDLVALWINDKELFWLNLELYDDELTLEDLT